MKTALIIVTLLLILSLAFNFLQTKENETELRSERLAKLHHKKLADSLERRARIQSDSLEIAFATIRSLNAQTQEAKEQTRKAIAYANSIKIVRFKTDAQRDSVLAVLYPSK